MNKNLFYIRLIQLLISNLGGIVTPIASFAVSAAITWGTLWIGKHVPGLADQITVLNASTVAASLATVLTGVVNMWLNMELKKEAYKLQKMLIAHGKDIDCDGWVGDETRKALHEVMGEKFHDGDDHEEHHDDDHKEDNH